MKRLSAITLALLLVFMSLPIVANAAPDCVYVGGVELTSGKYLAVGATSATSTKPSGGYAYYNNGVLTLSSYEYEGEGVKYMFNPNTSESSYYKTCIFAEGDLVIYCEGESYLTNTDEDGECISARGNVTFKAKDADSGVGLKGAYGIYAYSLTGSCEIRVVSGIIFAEVGYAGLGVEGYGAQNKASVIIEGGMVGVEAEGYGAAIYGVDCGARFLMKGGMFYADAQTSGIYVDGYEKVDVYIDGGDFRVSGGEYSGVDTYSETDATEFHHNGGSAMIFGCENAVTADRSYIQGSYFEASYDPENAVYEAAGLFSDSVSVSKSLVVQEGGFDQNYVKAEMPFTRGDVNDDGAIDQYDYILVKRHYFGTRILTDAEMLAADANNDGTINQYDYILIKRHYFQTFTIEN